MSVVAELLVIFVCQGVKNQPVKMKIIKMAGWLWVRCIEDKNVQNQWITALHRNTDSL